MEGPHTVFQYALESIVAILLSATALPRVGRIQPIAYWRPSLRHEREGVEKRFPETLYVFKHTGPVGHLFLELGKKIGTGHDRPIGDSIIIGRDVAVPRTARNVGVSVTPATVERFRKLGRN